MEEAEKVNKEARKKEKQHAKGILCAVCIKGIEERILKW